MFEALALKKRRVTDAQTIVDDDEVGVQEQRNIGAISPFRSAYLLNLTLHFFGQPDVVVVAEKDEACVLANRLFKQSTEIQGRAKSVAVEHQSSKPGVFSGESI